ncbi:MAG: phenylalanine--tRNA ligase subunit beta [Gammaproteobacteria bacterium]|nr:phenylalanine--tRNA ligase subunit beta [Gammaproteobacteria bacterium]
MKFSELWLREWVNPLSSTKELADQLTLAGLEVDSITPVAGAFSNVVVGEIVDIMQHPDADRLKVCTVDVGEGESLSIVCGGQNARKNIKVAVAKIDAVLPGNFKIKKSKLRGVESYGMLCSEVELGLAETSDGIMELPSQAPVGKNIRDYLDLDDAIIDIALTPNRGDCLSILGLAREVSVLNKLTLTPPFAEKNATTASKDTLGITLSEPGASPHYVGRIIRNINPKAQTPLWMKERLRRSDTRSISVIVDITNYVLLEMGQPLHAFDLKSVSSGIEVRYARDNECINLLDDQKLVLSACDLVIASNGHPVALAGIKGGNESGVTLETRDIFLESALFTSSVISKTTRKFGLFTEASHRYERGMDYKLQQLALERASQLILELAGGELGDIVEEGISFQDKSPIMLNRKSIARCLGINLSDDTVNDILTRLAMKVSTQPIGWQVVPPSYRNDINTEIDLIEELARIYGYQNIPPTKLMPTLNFLGKSETKLDISKIKNVLVDNGYQEAITYSFVDPVFEHKLAPETELLSLLNPISADLSVMRSNHWSGLIKAYLYNSNRQQPRIRLFEVGLCFINRPQQLEQKLRLGGVVAGPLFKEQWGETKRSVDFFDVKADIENILTLSRPLSHFRFETCAHPALHPGKTAGIFCGQRLIGYLGALHPRIAQEFDINQTLYLFDLDLESIIETLLPMYEAVSKFPAIRRDLALVVKTNVPADKIREKILDSGGELLKNVQIFDIYQGKGIEEGKKSIALSLIFQHVSRTLVDAEINDFMQITINNLHKEFNATLRD